MKRVLACAALLGLAASCRKKPAPLLDPSDARYISAAGDLRCEIPKDWRVMENQGGGQRASFFGPPAGAKPYSVSIGIYFYGPGTSFATLEDYARAQALSGREASPLKAFAWKGRAAQEMTVTRVEGSLHHAKPAQTRVDRYVMIPAGAGFYALDYSAPQGSEQDQAAVFDRVLQSLELPPQK